MFLTMLLQFILAFIVFDYVNGDDKKGSLTFIIDETRSMSDDIEQVKEQTNQLFDAVLKSNGSRIDDFIIVTFDDPDARLKIITRDPSEFKNALAAIRVHGNYDCPEYAMKGIELGLEYSKPNSFFYVFTDAAAKDYTKYERVKSLGLKKSIQVTFLLTGMCSGITWDANAVYDKLAAATNGQVFHLGKQDIRKIMHYIIASVNHLKTTLAHKVFDDDVNKKFQFSIDSKVWDVIISVSGLSPRYHIFGPDGNTVEGNAFITTEKSLISSLEAKPGVYTMHLDSEGATSIVITGSTSVSFRHGFSTFQPNTLNETSTKPIAGSPSYLSIALDNIDKDVLLDTIEIRNINDIIINEFPLTLKDKNQQFYVTTPLLIPNSTFKIAINGHTKSKEKITRVASTTIEAQNPELEGLLPKKPLVTILGDKIIEDYDKQITLKCKVSAYPKPDVTWQDNLENIYKSTIVPVDLPYEYMSIIKIDKVNKNVTIQCKAVNSMGEDTKFITVEIKRKPFFKVLEFPKDTTIEYGAQAKINFKVNAFPLVKIKWLKNGKQIKNNSDYEVSSDGSRLAISRMGDKLAGRYTVKAYNDEERKKYNFKIDIGVAPVIDKSISKYKAKKGSNVDISCRILESHPEPVITWTFLPEDSDHSKSLKEATDTLHLNNVGIAHTGMYSCVARNKFGKDYHVVDLLVGFAPVIDKSISKYKAKKGSNVDISCRNLESQPTPVISWTFLPEDSDYSKILKEKTDTLHLKNVALAHTGMYSCVAQNEFGKDNHVVDLLVGSPPTIQNVETQFQILESKHVRLQCKVDGYPLPTVRWLFNNVEIETTGKYIYYRNSLRRVAPTFQRFKGSIEDNGIYKCEASNFLGKEKKEFNVTIYSPINIKRNPVSDLYYLAGTQMELPCHVTGYPKPKIQWTLYKKDSSIAPKLLTADSTGSLSVERIQEEDEGFYRCSASNGVESKDITYEIIVAKSVVIAVGVTTYNAVVGDLALRIPCEARGNPKPEIMWETDDQNIVSGLDSFDIEEDGSLIINNPSLYETNNYTCKASNYFSEDAKEFKVNVSEYLQIGNIKETFSLENGTSRKIECDSHSKADDVRWFKDGRFIKSGELYLTDIQIKDSGVYSCRVSTLLSTQTIHKEVIVGYKPYFINEEVTNIDLINGKFATLNCSAYGDPEPQIIWRHNGKIMKTMDMTYTFKMKPDDIGYYQCVVSNKFGNIQRTFNIKYPKECLLDIESDFNIRQPLLLSRTGQWPEFNKINDLLRIPKSSNLLFACPGSTVTYNGEEFKEYIRATCIDNSIFKIRNRNVDFSKLKCREEIKSLVKTTNKECFSGNTELLKVGFKLRKRSLEVYDVCIDKTNKIPLFTRYNLHQGYKGILPKENLKFTGSKYLPFIFEDMYKCGLQLETIHFLKGSKLSSPNKCCFKKRQLVSPADVIPGLSQVATYSYLNVVPQWSSCGTENWDEIERRIRSIVNFSDIKISVFTGSSKSMLLPGQTSPVFLSDRYKKQLVPLYIWKVVQNTRDNSSLAIIQMNVPNITLPEANSYMPCKDICDEVEWMKNYQWHNVEKGFTFCCSITEFASYFGTLFKGYDKVFKTIPLVSEHSLI